VPRVVSVFVEQIIKHLREDVLAEDERIRKSPHMAGFES
jgi:hypothetical protein